MQILTKRSKRLYKLLPNAGRNTRTKNTKNRKIIKCYEKKDMFLKYMMTFMEVKGHQRSNVVNCDMATIFGQKDC